MSGYIGTQPVPQSTQTRDSFTATSGQTSFATGGYQSGYIDLYLNGIKLAAADYTATNNSDVVLAVGATAGDILEVVAYTAFNTANVTGAVDFTVTGLFTSRGIDDNADATAITIDSSENVSLTGALNVTGAVGIGTSSPARLAEIYGTTNPALRLNNGTANVDIGIATSSGALLSGSSANDLVIARNGAYNIKLGTNGTNRMTINSSGYVGIGTSPSFILDVVHPTDNGLARFTSGDADAYITISDVNSTSAANKIGVITHDMYFNTNGTERMRIDSSGNVGIGGNLGVNKAVTSSVGLSVGSDAASTTSYGLEVCNNTSNTRFLIDGLGNSTFYGSDNSLTAKFTSSGNVGIGTSAFVDTSKVQIEGAKTLSSGIPRGQLNISDQTAVATGVGGSINFSGNYSGTSKTTYGSIEGFKDNGTDGHYGGSLVFKTRTHASDNIERLRIDSSGNLVRPNHKIHEAMTVGYNTTFDTGISVNGNNYGKTLLVFMSGHVSSGMSTHSSLSLVRCGYDGNNTPVLYNLGGNVTVTVGKSASHTVTLHTQSVPVYQIMEIAGAIG